MKITVAFYFLLVLGWVFIPEGKAQTGSIQGTVTNGVEPLGFATLLLESTQKGTRADEEGTFLLEKIKPGKYTLTVSYVGYETQKQEVVVNADEISSKEFIMEASMTLDEVVVTGTMKPTYISASPIKVEVVTSRQLDTYLPSAASSVVEGVQLVNGVQEVVACGVCFTNSISINGLAGAYTAVLMDGTPMYGNLASVYGLNGIPNMIIDRFEVIKGPSSTLYGSEAVAGVINIITKDPSQQPILSVDVMGTSHMESFGNLAIAPKIGKSSGYVGLNYAYVNDFDDINGDGFGDGINMDRLSLFTKWNLHRKSGKKFSLAGKYYYEDRRNGVAEFLKNRAYRDLRGSDSIYGESIYTHRAEMFGTYELNTKPSLRVDFSLSNHKQDSHYGADAYLADQQIAFANLLWNTQVARHDILAGLTARYQGYDDNTIATEREGMDGGILNEPDNQFIPGVFVQDEYSLNERLTLLGGMRLDHYRAHGFIFAPRLSAKYKPSEWTTLRTNFGTGFRVVNLFTEDHAFITGQREVEIEEALNPEESYNVSVNVNHIYQALKGSGSIDLEGYFTHFTNKIIPRYDTPGKIIYGNSDGFARTMGIGVTLNHTFTFPLAFNLGLNVQRATETEPNALGGSTIRDIEFAPRWSAVFSANYQWEKAKTTFAYTARWTGNMALPEVFDLDPTGKPLPFSRPITSTPFSLHNIQVTKIFKENFSLYAGIQNLFNYRQYISPLIGYNDPNAAVGFSNYFDTSYAFAPNHGREFYLGVKWNLGRRAADQTD